MKFYVQFLEDGTISGTNLSSGEAPDHKRQLVFDEYFNVDGMRVDLKTKKIVPCAVIAKQRRNSAVHQKLQEIDAATPRALREMFLTGDKASLQNLEDRAAELRQKFEN